MSGFAPQAAHPENCNTRTSESCLMESVDVSHREIYDRLLAVELKVDSIEKNTADVVKAFNAAQGAFTVLEWFGKIAKPILFVGACVTAVGVAWHNFRTHL
jgi:hypothetical protein